MKNNLLTEQLAYNGDSRTKTHIHLIRYSAGMFEETLLDAFTPEAVAVGADEKIWLLDLWRGVLVETGRRS